jgi:hypothetical protein
MRADVELDVDTHEVRLALKRLDPEAEKRIRDVVKKDTIKARTEIRQHAPQMTGLLAASVRSRTQFTQKYSRGVVTVVGPARKYAWIVEHGSKGANAFPGKGYIKRAERVVLTGFDDRIRKAVGDAIEAAGLNE